MRDLGDKYLSEPRSSHCKIYVEPTVKQWIQDFADSEAMTFSLAGRELLLQAIEGNKG